MTLPYTDTVEHRAAVYSAHTIPAMREWAKQDFIAWIERHDREIHDAAYNDGFNDGVWNAEGGEDL